MSVTRRLLPPAVALAVAVAVGGAGARADPGAAGAAPRTLAYSAGPISAFAQDGGRIAWESTEDGNARCPFLVRIRTLSARVQKAVVRRGGPTCGDDSGFANVLPRPMLALAGDRGLWVLQDSGNNQYIDLVTGGLQSAGDRVVGRHVFENRLETNWSIVAGDGRTLVYGYYVVDAADPDACIDRGECGKVVKQGAVYRIVGTRRFRVPNVAPPALLAASGARVAVLSRGALGAPARKDLREVEVRDAVTGRLLQRFTAPARVRALAISNDRVVVLTARGLYPVLRNTFPQLVRVPPGTAPEVSVSPAGIVYRVGRSIWHLPPGGRATRVAVAAAAPIGLSIEGSRVAWAENVGSGSAARGRIQAVDVR